MEISLPMGPTSAHRYVVIPHKLIRRPMVTQEFGNATLNNWGYERRYAKFRCENQWECARWSLRRGSNLGRPSGLVVGVAAWTGRPALRVCLPNRFWCFALFFAGNTEALWFISVLLARFWVCGFLLQVSGQIEERRPEPGYNPAFSVDEEYDTMEHFFRQVRMKNSAGKPARRLLCEPSYATDEVLMIPLARKFCHNSATYPNTSI